MKQKDFYIRVLEFACSKTGIFTLSEIREEFSQEFENIDGLWDAFKRQIMKESILMLPESGPSAFSRDVQDSNKWDSIKLHATVEDRMRLLEYTELQEARQSSEQALGIAIIAIALNVIGLFYTIISG
ncbi:hypothetical protein LJ739_06695 [Aestuariibacter halophilus]|uniref:Uncharacterized protein n=1 Tax=Fluctibacter halophilus TaxID=226011 RepID=A0ABS8G8A4_9ALTE|nr:hypothetical protein [Aestuariibacter halophilus]MCC2615924.1 hypothetical protein [Aestuariibacter halophilus]